VTGAPHHRGPAAGGGLPTGWEVAAHHLRDPGPGPVLDVGCGTGECVGALARWSGRPVVGVDPDTVSPARAHRGHSGHRPNPADRVARTDAVFVAGRVPVLPLASGTGAAA
jgi:SAM-dependent methyltransferase